MTAILTTLMISGCALFSTDDEIATQLAVEAEAVQPLLAVLSAARSIYVPEDSTTQSITERTLNPITNTKADWAGKTPAEVYNNAESPVRVPASGLLNGLNNSSGDDYYFILSPYNETDAIYRVTLYIYPTTSASVYYILEEYLVDSSWAIVNSNGTGDATAFVRYETYYYDGGVDYRTPVAVYSSADNSEYALGDLFDPITDLDPETATSYDYPADPLTAVSPSVATDNVFSILVSGSGPVEGMNFYEYYAEGSAYNDRRAASFLYTDLSASYINGTEETVRRYRYDVTNDVKTVRSKTVTTMNLNGSEVVKTIYESVDIDMGEGTYDSTVKQEKVSGTTTTTTTTVTALTEGSTAGTYDGTVTVTVGDTVTEYTAALSSAEGLVLTDASGNTVIDGYNPVALEEGRQLITMELPEGGTIEAILTQGVLNGIIRSGRVADIIVGPNYVQVIYDTNRGRTRLTR